MYYFNYKLLERLDSVLKISKMKLIEEMGVHYQTYEKWRKGNIPCQSLVFLCNLTRVSLSSFLVLTRNPELKEEPSYYQIPKDAWKPVSWDSSAAKKLFGENGLIGVPNTAAAAMLGLSSGQAFERWAKAPSSMRIRDLMNLLNTFQVDATLFFKDPNNPLPMPKWELNNEHVARMVGGKVKELRELEVMNAEKEHAIHALRLECERLRKENLVLRARKEEKQEPQKLFGRVMDPEAVYASPLKQRGYVFHLELWDSLPSLFGLQKKEFKEAIGISSRLISYTDNHLISSLVAACNLLRISVTHFFLPKDEVPVVYDKAYYQISPRAFVPIEDCMDRMKYLFGKYSVAGWSKEDLRLQGVAKTSLASMAKKDGIGRVNTLCSICSSFNIPPTLFFRDENRKKAIYSSSMNERLLENAIEMMKEIETLRGRLRQRGEKGDK